MHGQTQKACDPSEKSKGGPHFKFICRRCCTERCCVCTNPEGQMAYTFLAEIFLLSTGMVWPCLAHFSRYSHRKMLQFSMNLKKISCPLGTIVFLLHVGVCSLFILGKHEQEDIRRETLQTARHMQRYSQRPEWLPRYRSEVDDTFLSWLGSCLYQGTETQ